jgi:hypothetical protein
LPFSFRVSCKEEDLRASGAATTQRLHPAKAWRNDNSDHVLFVTCAKPALALQAARFVHFLISQDEGGPMGRIPKGTDSAGNVLPDGRVTIGLSDGSELTGSKSVITSGDDADTVVITTRLSRVPASLQASSPVTINWPDIKPFKVLVAAVRTLPDGSTQMIGRVPGGIH